MITKRLTWSALVSAAVSALAITSVAGIVLAGDVDATNTHGRTDDRTAIDERKPKPAPESDYSKRDELRVQLQTDHAMEQSSRVLRELTKERAKDD